MPQAASPKFDEKKLTKGQLRKLTALRKSLGDDIANRIFAQWLKAQEKRTAGAADKQAEQIEEAVGALVKEGKIRIPRGGYLLTRGRNRIFVTRVVQG